ncbi:hypothetical protein D3C80_1792710 [compost metagenome]
MRFHRAAEEADIASPWRVEILIGEVRFACANGLRRKLKGLPVVESLALLGRTPDCGGGRHYLVDIAVARAEPVNGGLIETDNRSERPRDQMELVLDDKGWGRRAVV